MNGLRVLLIDDARPVASELMQRLGSVDHGTEVVMHEPVRGDAAFLQRATLQNPPTIVDLREFAKRAQPAVALVPGQPQREERAARARTLLDAAEKTRITGMRLPVYFTELAVAVRLALYGEADALFHMMGRHNEHMARCGVKGVIESLQ